MPERDSKTELRIAENAVQLAHEAAAEFVACSLDSISERGLFTVALSGGSTPRNLYRLLGNPDEAYYKKIRWDQIHFFWSDERHVGPEDPDSNYRMVREELLSRAPVPVENVHRIRGELSSAEDAAREYELTLRHFFRLTPDGFPRFDLMLLGLGADGHTASIFPGSPVLAEESSLTAAPWAEHLKSYRITLTLPVLNNARQIVFLVSGKDKAQVLKSVLENQPELEIFPAQAVRPVTGKLVWLVDREAAVLLKKPDAQH